MLRLLTKAMHREHLAALLTEARFHHIAQGIRHLICQCDMREGTVAHNQHVIVDRPLIFRKIGMINR